MSNYTFDGEKIVQIDSVTADYAKFQPLYHIGYVYPSRYDYQFYDIFYLGDVNYGDPVDTDMLSNCLLLKGSMDSLLDYITYAGFVRHQYSNQWVMLATVKEEEKEGILNEYNQAAIDEPEFYEHYENYEALVESKIQRNNRYAFVKLPNSTTPILLIQSDTVYDGKGNGYHEVQAIGYGGHCDIIPSAEKNTALDYYTFFISADGYAMAAKKFSDLESAKDHHFKPDFMLYSDDPTWKDTDKWLPEGEVAQISWNDMYSDIIVAWYNMISLE